LRLQAGQQNQIPGQIHDLDRLAHIQNTNLAACCHCRCLQNQLARLGNRHEEAPHLRVRHGDWSPSRDLFLEDRDHAAIGAEHVAKTNCDVASSAVLKREQNEFSDALGGAHDVGRAHSLVGGNQDEILDTVFHRGDGEVVGPQDIVLHGLEDVCLHKGNVFIRRGMINDGWSVLAENVVQAHTVLHVPDLGVERDLRESLFHFAIDLEQRRLGNFKSYDSGGLKTRNLPAKFRSNGSSSTSDENDLTLEHIAN